MNFPRCKHGRHVDWCDDCYKERIEAIRSDFASQRKIDRVSMTPKDRALADQLKGKRAMRVTKEDTVIEFSDSENGAPTTVRELQKDWNRTIADCRKALNEIERVWDGNPPDYDSIHRTIRCVHAATNDMREFAKGLLQWG